VDAYDTVVLASISARSTRLPPSSIVGWLTAASTTSIRAGTWSDRGSGHGWRLGTSVVVENLQWFTRW